MKIEMENITIMLPNENSGVDRKLMLEDDGQILQINFIGRNDQQSGGISLTKSQMLLLRDNLNTFIKNKLVE
tara:strand:+ start:618 stop:833 length:216 start_codon:yes stop_codon:yes gene_type:complete